VIERLLRIHRQEGQRIWSYDCMAL